MRWRTAFRSYSAALGPPRRLPLRGGAVPHVFPTCFLCVHSGFKAQFLTLVEGSKQCSSDGCTLCYLPASRPRNSAGSGALAALSANLISSFYGRFGGSPRVLFGLTRELNDASCSGRLPDRVYDLPDLVWLFRCASTHYA